MILNCDNVMGSDVCEHVNYSFIEQYISISVSASLSPTDFFYKSLELDLGAIKIVGIS